ncbi:MAG: class I SAM-dependent methyltransferase [Anaerolineales bacterium]|jgi:ubiquinone/menaquinone biosynthesis C-methylase UbiE
MAKSDQPENSLPQEVSRYYARGQEAGRFAGAAGELELVRTQEILSRYLPDPPATILDVGGGPGAYATWLAGMGYQVHLLDPVPLHLEQAEQASQKQPESPIASINLGEARKLSQEDGSIDALLLLGPLYHLTDSNDRRAALLEAHRVLKPGGLLAAAGISRFASTLAGLIDDHLDDAEFRRIVQRDLTDGQHRNPTEKPSYFTTAFFHHPAELKEEIEQAGFALESIMAIEGVAVFLGDLEARWQDASRRELLLEALRWLEGDPSIVGITGHLLAIGMKPA